MSTIEARHDGVRSRVNVSDLRGDARQLVYAIPTRFNWGIAIFATLADARNSAASMQHRGDRVTEWSRIAFTPTHQLTFQYSRFWFWRQCRYGIRPAHIVGVRFTPTVAGDISGDGLSNDRAYSSILRRCATPRLPTDCVRSLRPGQKQRDCLSGQRGHIAARNSCVGPWFTTMNGTSR